MEAGMIQEILEAIDADQIQLHSRNVQCCCFMSIYRKAHRYGVDSRPSMGISIDSSGTSLVHCFSCKYSAPLVSALVDLEDKSGRDLSDVIARAKAFERLDPEALIKSVENAENREKKKEKIVPEEDLEIYEQGYHPQMIVRGLTVETLKAWDSRWDAEYRRVVFPVRNFNKHLVGAVGRTTINSRVKYFNYFHFDKSATLFGEHMTLGDRPVVVVEGQLDTILLWQYFKENNIEADVIGLMGSDASKYQLTKLVRNWQDVILFMDNDFAGWTGQKNIARAIQQRTYLKVMTYPSDGGDPAELVKQGYDIKKMFEEASLVMVTRRSRNENI